MASAPGPPVRAPPSIPSVPSPSQPAVQSINIAALSTLPKPRRRAPTPTEVEQQVPPQHLRPISKLISPADLEYHLLPHLHSTRALSGWRLNLASKMHTCLVQNLLMFLLLCHVILVVAGIVLEGFHSTCVSCGTCDGGFDKMLTPNIQQVVDGLTLTSLTILCLFGLEIVLLLVALGWRFFTNCFYVLDAAVVAVALWSEIAAYRYHNPQIIAIPLLVLLRVWRLATIFHGVGVVVDTREEYRIQDLENLVAKQQIRIDSLERGRQAERQRDPRGAVQVHDQRSRPYEQDEDDSALLGDRI